MKLLHSFILFFLFVGFSAQADLSRLQLQGVEPQPVASNECAIILNGPKKTSLKKEERVVLTTWNFENIFEKAGKHIHNGVDPEKEKYDYKRAPERDRPHEDWSYEAKQNKVVNATRYLGEDQIPLSHFIIGTEIESINAAFELFNTGALKDSYDTYLIEGNDERGIDIAFAVRADLDVIVEAETHRNLTWFDPIENERVRLFSRDLPVFIIKDRETKEVLFVIMGNHGKSKRDRAEGRDFESTALRSAQYLAASEIIKGYMERFGENTPLIFAGDFNTDLQSGRETQPIRELLHDTLDIVGAENRVTHNFFPRNGEPKRQQLDGIFVNSRLVKSVRKAMVLPEFDRKTGQVLPEPESFNDRTKNYPSDHHAVSVVLEPGFN